MQSAPHSYADGMPWQRPSPAVQDLIRQCAQRVVNPRLEWLVELDAVVLAANPAIAATRTGGRHQREHARQLFLFWGTANLRRSGRAGATQHRTRNQ